jgi:hypothetical protein
MPIKMSATMPRSPMLSKQERLKLSLEFDRGHTRQRGSLQATHGTTMPISQPSADRSRSEAVLVPSACADIDD